MVIGRHIYENRLISANIATATLHPTSGGISLIVADFAANEINATLSGNIIRGNNIHDNTPQGIVLWADAPGEELPILSNNTITNNTIEDNEGWGVEIREERAASIFDNIFTNNVFAGNELGAIHGRVESTAVQARSWGEIKAESK
jgi:parallel beta-helix repeat protein